MKRFIITALAVVLIATPAWAAVTLSTSNSGCEVTLSYSVTGPNNVRAFALDITADSGATIDSISDLNTQYDIYPGSIVIVGGAVTDDGNAVADSGYAGTQGGLGTSGITIEMGSLYVGAVNEPNASGTLCKFVVSDDCNVSVAENTIRAGVVMENPDEDPSLSLPSTLLVTGCGGCTYGGSGDFAAVGSPDCWCASNNGRQCKGDADGLPYGKFNYWVSTNDLDVLIAGWNKTWAQIDGQTAGSYSTPVICADFDHSPYGKFSYRVTTPDLDILVANWQISNGPSATCP